MERLTVGILAHVDAGKTTLSEALLYGSGSLKKLGRVDHGNAFLDTHEIERERGITVFSKQAMFSRDGVEITLMDTPGHADLSAEAERVLQVLDCAVLVISGTDGVQGHTRTLWRLLERYGVPTFLFVNKTDMPGVDREKILEELRQRLDEGCVSVSAPDFQEQAALCDERLLARYLEDGEVPEEELRTLAAKRKLFPCWFGSALRLEGVEEFLLGLLELAPRRDWGAAFGARVYKVSRDGQGTRLTWLKVTGGSLKVKTLLKGEDWEEKVDQIRLYSGEKYRAVEEVPAGTVCAVTGLSRTRVGQGLGEDGGCTPPLLEPVLSCKVLFPEGCDLSQALGKFRQLEEEDPQLHLVWNEGLGELHIRLMGQVHLEVLRQELSRRFGLEVDFGPGGILYRETLAAPVVGIGHFEPLRHYAEVHLLMEPGERGSGLVLRTACPEDRLEGRWQRLILTHLAEKEHLGVLTGAPLTDLVITLVAGKAHLKHTEGGDFRQATYRAVRQGMMSGESVLLEPWYAFTLEVPAEQVGRAMTDLQYMGGEVEPPETIGTEVSLTGFAPVAGLRNYAGEVITYTRGRGRLSCIPAGYRPCTRWESVVEETGYDPERDTENPADSVFCHHGAGHTVSWRDVPAAAHVDNGLGLGRETAEGETELPRRSAAAVVGDEELLAIYERTYGTVKRRDFRPTPKPTVELPEKKEVHLPNGKPEYLLVDGYNIIFAWEELKRTAKENLDAARQKLMDLLSDYQGMKGCRIILVFDAYKVKGGRGTVEKYHNIHVVYTREAETADAYIEKTTYELGKEYRVRVATSDGVEQVIILGHGALRLSARAFRQEVEQAMGELARFLSGERRRGSQSLKEAYREAEKRKQTE